MPRHCKKHLAEELKGAGAKEILHFDDSGLPVGGGEQSLRRAAAAAVIASMVKHLAGNGSSEWSVAIFLKEKALVIVPLEGGNYALFETGSGKVAELFKAS